MNTRPTERAESPARATDDDELPLSKRVALLVVVGGLALVSYLVVARLTGPGTVSLHTALDDAIPFVPFTVWFYIPLYYGFFVVATWAIRTRAAFLRTLASVGIAIAVATAFFVVMPSSYPRPSLVDDGSLTAWALSLLHAADLANNTFPSLHVAMTTVIVLGCARESPRRALVLFAIAVFPTVSTLTTKQHFVVDVPGGAVVAAVAHLVAFRGFVSGSAPPGARGVSS